jgi:hypothetical protein
VASFTRRRRRRPERLAEPETFWFPGSDRVYGGNGRDAITGGADPSHLRGGPGNDGFCSGAAGDIINGMRGLDRASREPLDTLISIEKHRGFCHLI